MLRHGPVPRLGLEGHRPVDRPPPPEFLEDKLAAQATEIDKISRENHRLAETHGALREELVVAHQEMQRLQAHIGSVHTKSDIEIKRLLEKTGKIEADIHGGETVQKELHKSHLEAQSLFTARQELTAEIQNVTEELQEASNSIKNMPEMHAEMDQLRQEYQKLRFAFEYEKGSNMEQVERMQAMENNLISMAREVEKLRTDVGKAEKRASAPNPDPVYPPAGQGSMYVDRGHGQGGSYGDPRYGHAGGYVQGGPAGYPNAYERPQAQMTSGAVAGGMHSYGGASGAEYSNGYGRSQVQTTGEAASGEGVNHYGVSGVGHYDNAAREASASS